MYRHNSNTIPVTYGELLDKLKKGRRKGNWKKLKRREKGLYRTAMAYTKLKKKELVWSKNTAKCLRIE